MSASPSRDDCPLRPRRRPPCRLQGCAGGWVAGVKPQGGGEMGRRFGRAALVEQSVSPPGLDVRVARVQSGGFGELPPRLCEFLLLRQIRRQSETGDRQVRADADDFEVLPYRFVGPAQVIEA